MTILFVHRISPSILVERQLYGGDLVNLNVACWPEAACKRSEIG
jgi:hypothetical protein